MQKDDCSALSRLGGRHRDETHYSFGLVPIADALPACCRWMIPRNSCEMTRVGYLKWRNDLKKFHADKAGQILREVGYPEETVAKVQALNLKKNFPDDPDSRVLEDALCLVFLEFQFAELAARTAGDKMVNALQKSWKKMTPAAREWARKLNHEPREKSLLERALAEQPTD